MKMVFFHSGIFWGLVLIVIGLVMIINYVFNISLPIFKILFAGLLIYWGLKILFGGSCCVRTCSSSAFTNSTLSYSENQKDYSIVFGKAELDLTNSSLTQNKTIDVNAVFGDMTVILNRGANFEIVSNVAFGNIRVPDNNQSGFGNYNYKSQNFNSALPYLTIKAHSVFGNMTLKYSDQ